MAKLFIANLWTTQRNLKRVKDIPEMVKFLQNGGIFAEKIELHEYGGEIQINNGHHRIAAILHSGRDYLEDYEYTLIYTDCPRPRFKRLEKIWNINVLI